MRAVALLTAAIALTLGACAEITPPHPDKLLKSPFGKSSLRLGMTKTEVRELWGEPVSVETGEPDRWGSTRETWVYETSFGGAPAALEFNGESLTAFHE